MMKRQSILGKSLIFSITTIIVVGMATAIISYFVQDQIVKDLIKERTKSIANLWNSTFEYSDIEEAKSNPDINSSIQQQFITQLNELSNLEPDVAQGYIFNGEFANDDKEVLIVAVPQNIIDAGLPPGTTYKNPELLTNAVDKAIETKKTVHTSIYTDQFGTWQSTLIPVINEDGAVLAVFGVDVDASFISKFRTKFILLVGIGIVICLIVIGLIQLWGTRKMLSPVKLILEGINGVSKGNLNTSISVNSKDEFGTLSVNFNHMVTQLRTLLKDVAEMTNKVDISSNEFANIADETSQSTNAFASTIDEVASSLEDQSTSSMESAKAMEEMSIGIQKAAESSTVVAEKSELTLLETHKGKEHIQKAIQQMNIISDTVGDSANVIQQLGQRSKEIGSIVSVISSISEQTNLLALNAAIEAARAGEYGKGFAVVAEEVRKLAEQSQASATQITNLIKATQFDTEKAVEAMQKGTMEVKNGEIVIMSVGEIIERVVTATEDVSEQIQEISAIFEQMSASSEEVNASVDEISLLANKSLSSVANIASESQKQILAMKSMKSASKELASMVKQLEKKLNGFTID